MVTKDITLCKKIHEFFLLKFCCFLEATRSSSMYLPAYVVPFHIVAILGFLGIICVYYEVIADWTNHFFFWFGVKKWQISMWTKIKLIQYEFEYGLKYVKGIHFMNLLKKICNIHIILWIDDKYHHFVTRWTFKMIQQI
jgi:hypothetical protein